MTEQQPYDVVRKYPGFEVRSYPASAVAEVTVTASFERAGNLAFSSLLGYISGRNRGERAIAMTAPVVQERPGPQRIAMTAPVVQQGDEDTHTVAFVLPATMSAATAPEPDDPRVRIRHVPASLTAAVRFSGRWTTSAYERHRDALLAAVRSAGLTPVGAPRFARYDPPFTPWFLRRNEILVDVDPSGVRSPLHGH